jgi:hypothetical protein
VSGNVEFLTAANSGGFTNSGTVTVGAGVTLNVAGNFTQTGGTTSLNGATLQATSVNINGGTLSGLGTIIGNVTNAGVLDVGDSPNQTTQSVGLLAIKGNYTQTSLGTLNIEIGGNIAGTQYDQLAITGSASLNGTLDVSFINGFHPLSGVWTLLKYASRSGMFATAHVPPGHGVHYNPTSVTLS